MSYQQRRRKGQTLMTVLEYLHTPESVLPHELANGVLRVSDAPSVTHQRMVARLFLAIHAHATAQRLGEVLPAPLDVVLDTSRGVIVQPDLVFLSSARSHLISDRVYGPPDLVVEVLSPRPRIGTLTEHLNWFARYGVRECWTVNTERRLVDVLTFDGRRTTGRRVFERLTPIESDVLPGFDRSLQSMLGYL